VRPSSIQALCFGRIAEYVEGKNTVWGYILGDGEIDNQRSVARRRHNLTCRSDQFLIEGKALGSEPDSDWLGLWVAVESKRPERLLRTIRQQFFPTFDFMEVRVDADGNYWTHFRFC
jgi:hypothetical protein